jgi:hypothetical protein
MRLAFDPVVANGQVEAVSVAGGKGEATSFELGIIDMAWYQCLVGQVTSDMNPRPIPWKTGLAGGCISGLIGLDV